MNEQPKKRPWFQFHLPTLIVACATMSFLIYIYVRPKIEYGSYKELGWRSFVENPPVLVRDMIVSVGITLAVSILCEWFIRRKERRQ